MWKPIKAHNPKPIVVLTFHFDWRSFFLSLCLFSRFFFACYSFFFLSLSFSSSFEFFISFTCYKNLDLIKTFLPKKHLLPSAFHQTTTHTNVWWWTMKGKKRARHPSNQQLKYKYMRWCWECAVANLTFRDRIKPNRAEKKMRLYISFIFMISHSFVSLFFSLGICITTFPRNASIYGNIISFGTIVIGRTYKIKKNGRRRRPVQMSTFRKGYSTENRVCNQPIGSSETMLNLISKKKFELEIDDNYGLIHIERIKRQNEEKCVKIFPKYCFSVNIKLNWFKNYNKKKLTFSSSLTLSRCSFVSMLE